jgi:hypothetical protein
MAPTSFSSPELRRPARYWRWSAPRSRDLFARSPLERVRSLTLVSTWARNSAYSNNLLDLLIDLTRSKRDDVAPLENFLRALEKEP